MKLVPGAEVGFCARVIADMLHDADVSPTEYLILFYCNLFFGGVSAINSPSKFNSIVDLYKNTARDLLNVYLPNKAAYQSIDAKDSVIEDYTGKITRDTCVSNSTYCKCGDKCENTIFNIFDTGAAKFTGCEYTFIKANPTGEWNYSLTINPRALDTLQKARENVIQSKCIACARSVGTHEVITDSGIVLLKITVSCSDDMFAFYIDVPKVILSTSLKPNATTTAIERRCTSTEREIVKDAVSFAIQLQQDQLAADFRARMHPNSQSYGASNVILWPLVKKTTDIHKFMPMMSYCYVEHMCKFWGDFGQIMGAIQTGSAVGTGDRSMISICLYLGVPVALTNQKVQKTVAKYIV